MVNFSPKIREVAREGYVENSESEQKYVFKKTRTKLSQIKIDRYVLIYTHGNPFIQCKWYLRHALKNKKLILCKQTSPKWIVAFYANDI